MTFLRDIVADLREKRLWPLAVVLALALVAVPIALGRGGKAPAPAPVPLPPVTATPAAAPGTAAAVRLVAPPAKPKLHGKAHDPFGAPGGTATTPSNMATPPPPASSPTSGGGSSSSSTPGSGGSSTPAVTVSPHGTPTTTTPTTPTTPSAGGFPAGYSVDLSFGEAGSTKALKDTLRLRALHAADGPLAVFLGVREKPRTAVFLLAPGVSATGDGRCRPTPRDCQVLELAKDESEFFDVQTSGAGIVQFELDADRIAARTATSAAGARRVLRRQSAAGRKIMFDLAKAGQGYLSHYMYKSDSGVLETHAVSRFVGG